MSKPNLGKVLSDYRDILWREYELRREKNPQYSLRAFARDLNVSNQKLSQVMGRKLGLSLKSAHEIVKNLNLSVEQTNIFLKSVEALHSRAKALRDKAFQELKLIQLKNSPFQLGVPTFQLKWYHPIIIIWIQKNQCKVNDDTSLQKIVDLVGIDLLKVKKTMQELISINAIYVDEGSNYIANAENFSLVFKNSNAQIRNYYKEMVQEAKESIEKTSNEKRETAVALFWVGPNGLKLAREKMAEFRRQLISELANVEEADEEIYALFMQLFPLKR